MTKDEIFETAIRSKCAILIKEDEIELVKPELETFSLEELQNLVGGYIQFIDYYSPNKEFHLLVDEEGTLKDVFDNKYTYDFTNYHSHYLKGNILLVPTSLVD